MSLTTSEARIASNVRVAEVEVEVVAAIGRVLDKHRGVLTYEEVVAGLLGVAQRQVMHMRGQETLAVAAPCPRQELSLDPEMGEHARRADRYRREFLTLSSAISRVRPDLPDPFAERAPDWPERTIDLAVMLIAGPEYLASLRPRDAT